MFVKLTVVFASQNKKQVKPATKNRGFRLHFTAEPQQIASPPVFPLRVDEL
jgi:hypothetical protein